MYDIETIHVDDKSCNKSLLQEIVWPIMIREDHIVPVTPFDWLILCYPPSNHSALLTAVTPPRHTLISQAGTANFQRSR